MSAASFVAPVFFMMTGVAGVGEEKWCIGPEVVKSRVSGPAGWVVVGGGWWRWGSLFRDPMITWRVRWCGGHAGVCFLTAFQHRCRGGLLSVFRRTETEWEMPRTKVVAVAVLAVVLTWSTVMIVFGHAAAAAVLLPSLGLIVQQIVQVLSNDDGPARSGCPGTAGSDGPGAAR